VDYDDLRSSLGYVVRVDYSSRHFGSSREREEAAYYHKKIYDRQVAHSNTAEVDLVEDRYNWRRGEERNDQRESSMAKHLRKVTQREVELDIHSDKDKMASLDEGEDGHYVG